MSKYLVYTVQGTGGMFVSSLLGLIHGYDMHPEISAAGDCHNITANRTSTLWGGTKDFNVIGSSPGDFLPNRKIFYAHSIDLDMFKKSVKDAKVIFIGCSLDDVPLVTKLYVNKVWPIIWTQEEYNKWVGPDWPTYAPDNVIKSDMIRNELINNLSQTIIKPWIELNQSFAYDYYIPFKTVMGLDQSHLADKLAEITGCQISCKVQEFIVQYQELNKKLYINE